MWVLPISMRLYGAANTLQKPIHCKRCQKILLTNCIVGFRRLLIFQISTVHWIQQRVVVSLKNGQVSMNLLIEANWLLPIDNWRSSLKASSLMLLMSIHRRSCESQFTIGNWATALNSQLLKSSSPIYWSDRSVWGHLSTPMSTKSICKW